jgi:carboxymethylenebutenolidase
MIEKDVLVVTKYGRQPAFTACPDEPGRFPGIILYMDAPGFREELRDQARRIAKHGYFCLLPDLYYRLGTIRFDIPRRNDAMSVVIRGAMQSLTNTAIYDDTAGMLAFLDAQDKVAPGPVGCVGHCMSGPFAVSVAARFPRIKAAASLYGVNMVTDQPDSPHLQLGQVNGELYLAFAEVDPSVPANVIPDLKALARPRSSTCSKRFGHAPRLLLCGARRLQPGRGRGHVDKLFDLWDRNLVAMPDKHPWRAHHYEVHGRGYPVLLFAWLPGSRIERWSTIPARPGVAQDWLDPITELSDAFQLIALDVRNAGQSWATIGLQDDWTTYTGDHLTLLDHLGVKQCHVMGACIGVSFALDIVRARPRLVSGLVLQNPIGLSDTNRAALDHEFDLWADAVKGWPNIDAQRLPGFRQRMFGGDFIFSVTREFVRNCAVPALLMPGDDVVHPTEVSADLARMPNAEVLAPWKGAQYRDAAMHKVREFFVATCLEPNPRDKDLHMTKIALLDDWQRIARSSADWSPLIARADVSSSEEPFAGRTMPLAVLQTSTSSSCARERTPFPASLVASAQAAHVRPDRRPGRADRHCRHDFARHHRVPHGWRGRP